MTISMNDKEFRKRIIKLIHENLRLKKQIRYDLKTAIIKIEKERTANKLTLNRLTRNRLTQLNNEAKALFNIELF